MCATWARILDYLVAGEPRSCRDIIRLSGFSNNQVYKAVSRAGVAGCLLRISDSRLEINLTILEVEDWLWRKEKLGAR